MIRPLLLRHHLKCSLAAEENAREIDIDDLLPLIKLHAHHESILCNARVVHDHVNSAELVDGGLEHFIDLLLGRDIALHSDGICAVTHGLDLFHGFLRRSLRARIVNDNLAACLAELEGAGPADAARCPRHDDNLSRHGWGSSPGDSSRAYLRGRERPVAKKAMRLNGREEE